MAENQEYYRQRMLEEVLRAETATNRDQRQMHLEWAQLYEEYLHPRPSHLLPPSAGPAQGTQE